MLGNLVERVALRRAEEQMADADALKVEISERRNQGESHRSAKLDRETAEELRERCRPWVDAKGVVHPGEPIRALSREYGLDPKTVRKCRDGITWRSTGAEPIAPVHAVEDEDRE